jgi:hypothetical protein
MADVTLTTEFVNAYLQLASKPEQTRPSMAADKESPGEAGND